MRASIKVIPFPDMPDCYIVISTVLDTDSPNGNRPMFSFFAVCGDDLAVEWEPAFGPITVIYACDASDSEAQSHWFFPYYKGNGYWSQLAVKGLGLGELFARGDYVGLFSALRYFVEKDEKLSKPYTGEIKS